MAAATCCCTGSGPCFSVRPCFRVRPGLAGAVKALLGWTSLGHSCSARARLRQYHWSEPPCSMIMRVQDKVLSLQANGCFLGLHMHAAC
jgi:hypothetical protein